MKLTESCLPWRPTLSPFFAMPVEQKKAARSSLSRGVLSPPTSLDTALPGMPLTARWWERRGEEGGEEGGGGGREGSHISSKGASCSLHNWRRR